MKKRFKIALTIVCMCLTVITLSFGVYAAISHQLAISNYILFETTEINVTINSLEVYQNNTYNTTNGVKLNVNAFTALDLYPDDVQNWSDTNGIAFTSHNPYLVFSFSVTNNSLVYDAAVTINGISLPNSTSNIDFIKNDGTVATITEGTSNITYSISKNTTQNIYFAAKIKALETSISSGELKFTLYFTNA